MNPLTWIADLWNWSMEARWRTWLFHGLLALALAYFFGAWTVMVFYLLREIEQVWTSHLMRFPQDWSDHFGDIAAPFLVCGLLSAFLGW